MSCPHLPRRRSSALRQSPNPAAISLPRRRRLRRAGPLVAARAATPSSIARAAAAAAALATALSLNPLAAKPPHVSRQGQVRHLVLPRRRTEPPRPVRSQADARRSSPASRCPPVSRGRSRRWATPPTRRCWPAKRKFKQYGQSGIWVSDWLSRDRHLRRRHGRDPQSCWADGLNHVGSVCQMNTGSILGGRPVLGSWVLYGLGSRVRQPARLRRAAPTIRRTRPAAAATGAPASCRPPIRARNSATAKRRSCTSPRPKPTPAARAARQARLHPAAQPPPSAPAATDDDDLEARIASYELAYRMQAAAPEAVDICRAKRPKRCDLYGLDEQETAANGRNCLLARRLVERGVRFVQLYMGSGSKWDAHTDVEGNHAKHCRETDQADRRPAHRPEAPRPARQHAGHLGRRIRPHAR